MASFNQYSDATDVPSVSAQGGQVGLAVNRINIPLPHVAAFKEIVQDPILGALTKLGENVAVKAFEAKGVQDQIDNPGSAVAGGWMQQIAGEISPIAASYNQGANKQYAVEKEIQLDNKITELKDRFPHDPEGFQKAIAGYKGEWLKDVPALSLPGFAKIADADQIRAVGQINQQTDQFNVQKRTRSLLESFDERVSKIYDGLRSGKMTDAEAGQVFEQMRTLIEAGLDTRALNPLQAKELTDKAGFNVRDASLWAAYNKGGGQGFVDAVRDGKTFGNVEGLPPFTPEQRKRLGAELQTEQNRRNSEARAGAAMNAAILKKQSDDKLADLRLNGVGDGSPQSGAVPFTEEQITTMFRNPQDRVEYKNKQDLAVTEGQFNRSIALMSPAEQQAALAQFKDRHLAPGATGIADSERVYNRMQAVVAHENTEFNKDPAGYLLARPETSMLREAMGSDNPEMRAIAREGLLNLQRQKGLGEGEVTVLPKAMVSKLVTNAHEGLKNDPVRTGEELAALAAEFGPLWPKVREQLSKGEHGLSPNLELLSILTGPQDGPGRTDFLNAIKLSDKERKELLDSKDSGLRSAIRQNVERQLPDFKRSELARGSDTNYLKMENGVTALAEYYAGVLGMSAADAAKKASQVFIGKYDFVGTARVPTGMGPTADSYMKDRARSLMADRLVPPLNSLSGNSAFNEKDQQTQYIDAARNGRWVTNRYGADPSHPQAGVMLTYQNGLPVRVRDENGREQPVVILFKDMTSKDGPPPAEYGTMPVQNWVPESTTNVEPNQPSKPKDTSKPAYGRPRAPLRSGNPDG